MPTLELQTNVRLTDPKAFALELSKFGAETLNKDEAYISVSYTYNETLTFAGTFDPAFNLVITSLDNLNPDLNEKYSEAFFSWFEKKLGVPHNRAYIVFNDPGREYMGYMCTHFGKIFGTK